MIHNGVDQRRELSGITKGTIFDGLKDAFKHRVEMELRVEVRVPQVLNVFREIAKEEDVVFANFAGNFDLEGSTGQHVLGSLVLTTVFAYVSTVAGADDQAAIEDELHVRRAVEAVSNKFIGAPVMVKTYPEASVPAVEICSEISLAGQIISALLTL